MQLEERAAQVLAVVRAAGTSAAALDAFFDTLSWNDELSAPTFTPVERARLRLRICETLQALLELCASALRAGKPGPPVRATDTLAAVLEICSVIDVVSFARGTLDEAGPWVEPWLARAEQRAAPLWTAIS